MPFTCHTNTHTHAPHKHTHTTHTPQKKQGKQISFCLMNLCQLEQIAIKEEYAEIQLLILSYRKEHWMQDS